jgi:hypothetical protein
VRLYAPVTRKAAGALHFRESSLVLLSGVEIFSAGTQTDSSGFSDTFTVEDLDLIVERFSVGSPEFVPVKLGHTSDEFNELVAKSLNVPAAGLTGENGGEDGVISLGRVSNLRRIQNKLVADFDIPAEMKDLVDRGFLRDVSVEMVGKSGDWTLTAVAWLGAELPAVKDLNGLAAAATLRQKIAGPVMAFKQRASVPDKETEMDLLKLFRSASDEEKAEIAELLNFEEEDEEDDEIEMEDEEGGEDTATVAPITGEAAAAVKAILGCEMNCSDEELIESLRNMVGLPSSAPTDEVIPVMKQRLEEKPVAFKDTAEFKQMSEKIAALEGDKKLAYWKEQVTGLLIQGKDEDLAQKLVDTERSAGREIADELLRSWKAESEANRRYTTSVGHNQIEDDDTEYEFEARARKIAEDEEITFEQAKSKLALEDGPAWTEYRAEKGQRA